LKMVANSPFHFAIEPLVDTRKFNIIVRVNVVKDSMALFIEQRCGYHCRVTR
jgi:hypothetical protein